MEKINVKKTYLCMFSHETEVKPYSTDTKDTKKRCTYEDFKKLRIIQSSASVPKFK